MTNVLHHPQFFSMRPATLPQAANLPVLTGADRQRLEQFLMGCDTAREPFLVHVLRRKLDAPEFADAKLPRDAVGSGSTLSYRIDDGPEQSGLLCHRSRFSGIGGVIPLLSLLGVTLIGMRVGQRAPLLREDGSIAAVTVIDVTHPA